MKGRRRFTGKKSLSGRGRGNERESNGGWKLLSLYSCMKHLKNKNNMQKSFNKFHKVSIGKQMGIHDV